MAGFDDDAPPVVLLVDADPNTATAMSRVLAEIPDVDLHHCPDVTKAAATAERLLPTVILQTLDTPEVNALDLIAALRAQPATAQTPVVLLGTADDPELRAEAFRRGATDFLIHLPHPAELIARVQYHSRACRLLQKAQALHLAEKEQLAAESHAEVLRARNTLIFGLAKLAESRDADTGEHLDRIAAYCRVLAEQLRSTCDLSDEWIVNLQLASSLHDIGKVGIPDSVLLKPGLLTPEERLIIERHPAIGAEALDAILARDQGDSLLRMARNIAASHHERWDGTGYPARLSGDAIPLEARIVSVADVYDALTSKRVYKPAFSHDEALRIIVRGRGEQFDPQIVDALCSCEIVFRHAGLLLHGGMPERTAPIKR